VGVAVCAKEFAVPESQLSSVDLDPRRRRALFRAWHRGMREMDIILGQFADAFLPTMSEADLETFERLMEELDRDVLMWITGEAPVPVEWQTPFFERLRDFHTHSGPINV
jgi:antitoxin CptB